jgi:hypothetical protein
VEQRKEYRCRHEINLSLSPGPATFQLCDLGHVTKLPLSLSLLSSNPHWQGLQKKLDEEEGHRFSGTSWVLLPPTLLC